MKLWKYEEFQHDSSWTEQMASNHCILLCFMIEFVLGEIIHSSSAHNLGEESDNLDFDRKLDMVVEARVSNDVPTTNFILIHDNLEGPMGVPPEIFFFFICYLYFCFVSSSFFPFAL
ncbi:hypothetical protein RJT34_06788 [Clitoria ternatea]|uniref:Uncharacterized protein n=1 Tax=Clitoria ternatea TaxID=43366 RepID=A0AAN9PTQ7_CLITE